jgi:hypothetical protein
MLFAPTVPQNLVSGYQERHWLHLHDQLSYVNRALPATLDVGSQRGLIRSCCAFNSLHKLFAWFLLNKYWQSAVLTLSLHCSCIMAGTIQPIAALTYEDFGPINTIVSIVLPVTSILVAVVRMAMRRQKFYQLEPDDIVYCAALV